MIPGSEHVNSYDENHFKALGPYNYKIFYSKGWGSHGWSLWFNQYPKNILRPFLGKQIVRRQRQIMFHFFNGTNLLGAVGGECQYGLDHKMGHICNEHQ